MRFFLLICLLLPLSLTVKANRRLKTHCAQVGGTVVQELTCPKSKLKLSWKFCLTEDQNGRPLFFDGCTGPSGGHTDLFYPACIQHDYCYHHEPATHGYQQVDCDQQFLKEALNLCAQANDQKKCRAWAKAMYRALRSFGKIAFNCADYEADYHP
jgi:hypothetical protein